ncbi:MAG: MGMT family protein [Dehalococcoidales bacterium]|jgi:O-6-methylguanine DNA methyltransferase
MAKKLSYTLFQTKQGWMGILASPAGILAVTLPQTTRQQAFALLGEPAKQAVSSPDTFSDTTRRFQDYYSGKKTTFPDKLDFSDATPFRKQVWQAAQQIPHGETRSYGWLAKQIGKPQAARAVGQALGKNPFLIVVPCHRVIAGDGTLGGFGCGLPAKRQLLALEKAKQ